MQIKNDEKTFGVVTRVLHWVIAGLVFGLFGLGLWMRELDYTSQWYTAAPDLHISLGIVLAVLVIVRFIWRAVNRSPALLGDNQFEHVIAVIVHVLLYALMVVIVVTGFIYATADGHPAKFFGLFGIDGVPLAKPTADWISDLHEWMSYVIIALAVVHTVGAIKHHYIDKDDTLRRMLSGSRANKNSND